ncbi:MAG TPA: DASS family sodium-coupled anion symporter [Dehalococcoidia bacterium]|nr:DASS family sodium-coupled anion symporter [Dehalococcoidia bacterium]
MSLGDYNQGRARPRACSTEPQSRVPVRESCADAKRNTRAPSWGFTIEPKFSRTRLAGLAAGPVVFTAVLLAPLPTLSWEAQALVAVYVWAVLYWITEALPVPVTAVMSSVLAVVLGVAPARTVFSSYGDPVIFLFLGSFMLAEAMRATGLDRRFAFAVLGLAWATRSPGRLLATMGIVTCFISLWVSNTATTAIMLPIGQGMLASLGLAALPGNSRYPIGFMLMLTWSSSVAVGLPVASPPNLIAIGMLEDLAGQRLTFFDWVLVTMPLTVLMLALCWLLLHWRYPSPAGVRFNVSSYVASGRAELGPWTRAQWNVAAVFALAAVFWMLPGAVAAFFGAETGAAVWLEAHLPESAVALLAAVLLFALPVDLRRGEFTLSWERAVRIDWGTILLFGGGLALGRLTFDTGLAELVGNELVRLTGAESVWALTAVAIVVGVALSELSSNTASASAVIPIFIAISASTGVSPVPPVLGAALGASFGFMLPISTPPNAIVYGSGLVPLREMVRSGIWLDLSGAVLIWAGLRVLCPLFGVM